MNSLTNGLTRSLAPAALAFALALLSSSALGTCFAQTPPVVVVVPNEDARGPQRQTPRPPAQQQQTAARPDVEASRATASRERGMGSITGRVVGESGEPVVGALVSVGPRGATQFFRALRTTTDEEGNFRVSGLDPGLYVVFANVPGLITEIDPSTNRPAAYRPGDTAAIRLVKGGVITGTVTDPQGEPVVAVGVRAFRVRDLEGRPAPFGFNYGSEDSTDDRGVYRIYGLQPGVYVVSAGSSRDFYNGMASPYAGNAPTFFPSGTRDTASELTVRAGQENAGVDIRYRDEQGRRVTGRVELPQGVTADPNFGATLTLAYASSGIQLHNVFTPFSSGDRPSFSFEGVPDGDYDVQATAGGRDGQPVASATQRISVRGADVTGLRLLLAPLASVSGSLLIEPSTEAGRAGAPCKQQRPSMLLQETLVTLVADRTAPPRGRAVSRMSVSREAAPDTSGAFTLRGLEPGRYRLFARPFDEALYVRSVQLPAASAATAAAATTPATAATGAAAVKAPAREALELRAGQQLSGVVARLAAGAAFLSGRVVAAEGAAAPAFSQTRVHLVPAEREGADDALRYFDATPDGSGAFTFKNVPPGRYLLVTRPAPEPTDFGPPRPTHWDADSRARLRRDAEAVNAAVELQPCQRTTDFTLRLPK